MFFVVDIYIALNVVETVLVMIGDSSQLLSYIQNMLDERSIPGAVLVLVKDGDILFSHAFGDFDTDSIFPVASATKLVSATLILSLASEGVLGLDDAVAEYLPHFTRRKAAITIRHLLACTSGLPPRVAWQSSNSLSLEESVDRIARVRLEAAPGKAFIYGGVGFQVAGRVAEVASGKAWHQLFQEKITTPLGMMNSGYGQLDWKGRYLDTTQRPNPRIGGALWTTPRDYARILNLLLNRGEFDGHRLIEADLVQQMFKSQIEGAITKRTVSANPDAKYSLGAWVEAFTVAGDAALISSPGVFGFFPWINLEQGYGGLIAMNYHYEKLGNWYPAMVEMANQLVI